MSDVDVSHLVAAAIRIQDDWETRGFKFCFIGGLAVQRWGEPRTTGDVDATVWTDFGNERPVIDSLLTRLEPRIANATGFALINRVLLVREALGVNVDVALAAFPFERGVIDRSQKQAFGENHLVRICGPSDLVILKAFANRTRDWTDIRGILIRSGSQLDWRLIDTELTCLATLKEEPEILEQLDELRNQVG